MLRHHGAAAIESSNNSLPERAVGEQVDEAQVACPRFLQPVACEIFSAGEHLCVNWGLGAFCVCLCACVCVFDIWIFIVHYSPFIAMLCLFSLYTPNRKAVPITMKPSVNLRKNKTYLPYIRPMLDNLLLLLITRHPKTCDSIIISTKTSIQRMHPQSHATLHVQVNPCGC